MGQGQVPILRARARPRSIADQSSRPMHTPFLTEDDQDSSHQTVRRRHAVRRHHRQPAILSSTTRGWWARRARPSTGSSWKRAKELDPRCLAMVIPIAAGSPAAGALDALPRVDARDDRLRSIDDYLAASDVFPGVGLKGGVCYFLWDRDNRGPARITTSSQDWPASTATRPLLEAGADVFARFNEGLPISPEGRCFRGWAIPSTVPARRESL